MSDGCKKLFGKVAIVTGGSSGIGRAIAIAFAENGAKVVVADIRDSPRENTTNTVEEIGKLGIESFFKKTDVSDEKSVSELIESCVERYGKLDILVNNAGITSIKSALEMTGEEFLNILNVNVKGAFLGSKYALKYMVKQKKGKIINLASNFSFTALGNISAYVTSKTAVLGLTRALAIEFAPFGINVNAVSPGATKTEFTRPFWDDSAGLQELATRTPLRKNGEFLVKPSDIGKAAVFLASDDSDMMTGTSILIDGGWNAW